MIKNDKVALSAKGPAQCIICMKPSLPAFSQSLGSKIFKDFKACAVLHSNAPKLVFGGGQHILSAKVRGRKRCRCFFFPSSALFVDITGCLRQTCHHVQCLFVLLRRHAVVMQNLLLQRCTRTNICFVSMKASGPSSLSAEKRRQDRAHTKTY